MIDPQHWTPEQLKQYSIDLRQFFDMRESTLPNGMRIIDAYNASGLHFTILPDRGMDIWTAHFKGIPLTWIAQGSPFAPDFGQTWLQQFNGGLLATCGLTHVGDPETDDLTGEFHDLHGRINRLRAADLSIQRGENTIELRGTIMEGRMFGEQLRLERTFTLFQNKPEIRIADSITNLGDEPAPLMLLYHINVGFPLVSAGAELHTPYNAVHSRTDEARRAYDQWSIYAAPQASFKEQVYFHHVKQDANASTCTLLQNGDFGFRIGWQGTQLPYFTQWKNTRQGIYVNGIEPGNCIPEGLNSARKTGRLQMIEPGETVNAGCILSVLDGEQAIRQVRAEIDDLQASGTPTSAQLDDYPTK